LPGCSFSSMHGSSGQRGCDFVKSAMTADVESVSKNKASLFEWPSPVSAEASLSRQSAVRPPSGLRNGIATSRPPSGLRNGTRRTKELAVGEIHTRITCPPSPLRTGSRRFRDLAVEELACRHMPTPMSLLSGILIDRRRCASMDDCGHEKPDRFGAEAHLANHTSLGNASPKSPNKDASPKSPKKSRRPKHVSFQVDCKNPPPTSILSLCRDPDVDFFTPSS